MMAKNTPETTLKRAAVQLLKTYGIKTWAYPGGVMGQRGMPDRIGLTKEGRFLGIEFKANNRPLSEWQEKIKREIEKAGGLYIVCRRLEDLIEGLNLGGRLF